MFLIKEKKVPFSYITVPQYIVHDNYSLLIVSLSSAGALI